MAKNKKNSQINEKRASKIGLSPGSLVYVGEEYTGKTKIHLTKYNPDGVSTTTVNSEDEIKSGIEPDKVNWLNITGIHNAEVIDRMGQLFGIHPLVLEDILNTQQRPKLELHDDFLFFNMKVIHPGKKGNGSFLIEQVSIILGDHYLISFQEFKSDYFKSIRKRIDRESSRLRTKNSDYLLFALVDVVVDQYLLIIDKMGDDIQELEDEIYDNPERNHLYKVMSIKRNLLYLRKIILPLKESLLKVKLMESELIDPKNKIYFEDIFDHISTVQESLELYFELNKSLRESYMSSISFKTNEVMKLLTIISTLFIPLTFIVGVYGMNFINMPELSWNFGYFYIWGVMIAITITLIFYFKKRKWL